jgi:hypothetical protein
MIMRKLFLASFKFKTGDLTFEEQRIVAIECDECNSNDEETELATDNVVAWFRETFPESELISAMAYPTIQQTVFHSKSKDKRKPFYSEEMLIEFGQYVFENPQRCAPQVSLADVHGWLNVRGRKKD